MDVCASCGSDLHCETAGAGPDVVLLHHGTASHRSWRRLTPMLTPWWRVTTYDRPGFGDSGEVEPWPRDYHHRDVDDLFDLLDDLAIDSAILVGHSDGATVALLAAARHPQRVVAVVAEAPHVTVEVPRCPDAVERTYRHIFASDRARAGLARQHGAKSLAVLERWHDRWCDPGFWSWDVSGALTAIECPVLVVAGVDDPFFSPAHAEMIASSIAHAELELMPSVAHQPHVEALEMYAQRLMAFLNSVAGG